MRGRKTSLRVILTSEERRELERWLRCTMTRAGLARRCRVILGVADGLPLVEVAPPGWHATEKHVRKWTTRFLKGRLEGLQDRPGRRPTAGLFPPRSRFIWSRSPANGRIRSVVRCRTGIVRRLARQLKSDGVVDARFRRKRSSAFCPTTRLKPWRKHLWLSSQVPRDAEFCRRSQELCTLYTRKLAPPRNGAVRGRENEFATSNTKIADVGRLNLD